MKYDLSVVIPVYRSEKILPELILRLSKVLPLLSTNYEVIFVCDGSPDNSWQVIREISEKFNFVTGINLSRNYGQHNALLVGIRDARYDVIVTMDDDLQHPPEEIYKLLSKLSEGNDVVYGNPELLRHDNWRNTSSKLVKFIMKYALGYEHARDTSAFRAFRTSLRDAFSGYKDKFVSIDILLIWATNKFSSVYVKHSDRYSGVSGYNFVKLLRYAINIITSFSSLPLQIASLMGFIFMLIGLLIFAYVLLNYALNGGSVPGFTFIASMISIFSGVQLFSLGIIGEYISRIHFRSMGQPYAIVKEKTSD